MSPSSSESPEGRLLVPRQESLIREVTDRFRVVNIHNRERVIIENSHPPRTAKKAAQLAQRMGLRDLDEFKLGATLHDIGKCHEDMQPLMKILKGKKYSAEQRMIVRVGHTKFGPAMLELLEQFVGFRGLPLNRELVHELCLYHHPEIDLERTKRRIEVKILSVVDKYDALTSGEDERSHREKPHTQSEAILKLVSWGEDGTLDKEVVQVFVRDCLA